MTPCFDDTVTVWIFFRVGCEFSMFPVSVSAALRSAVWQRLNDGYTVKCACVAQQGLGVVVTNLSAVFCAFLTDDALMAQWKTALPNFHAAVPDVQRLVLLSLCRGPPDCEVQTQLVGDRLHASLTVRAHVSVALPRTSFVTAQLVIPLVNVRDSVVDPSMENAAFAAALREYVVLPLAALVEQHGDLVEILATYLPPERSLESVIATLPSRVAPETLSVPSRVTLLLSEMEVRRIPEAIPAASRGGPVGAPTASTTAAVEGEGTQAEHPRPPTAEAGTRDPTSERLKKIKRVFR